MRETTLYCLGRDLDQNDIINWWLIPHGLSFMDYPFTRLNDDHWSLSGFLKGFQRVFQSWRLCWNGLCSSGMFFLILMKFHFFQFFHLLFLVCSDKWILLFMGSKDAQVSLLCYVGVNSCRDQLFLNNFFQKPLGFKWKKWHCPSSTRHISEMSHNDVIITVTKMKLKHCTSFLQTEGWRHHDSLQRYDSFL